MVSGLVLKYLNGECFVIRGFYKYTRLASTEFNLTVPSNGMRLSIGDVVFLATLAPIITVERGV